DVCAGFGGKYLILRLKKLKQLAIFDSDSAKIIKFLPIDSDDLVFAAGAEKLIVLLNDRNIIQRWSLRTLERELSVPGLEEGASVTAAMGYNSDGPALFHAG